jgi:hypothetical protein
MLNLTLKTGFFYRIFLPVPRHPTVWFNNDMYSGTVVKYPTNLMGRMSRVTAVDWLVVPVVLFIYDGQNISSVPYLTCLAFL